MIVKAAQFARVFGFVLAGLVTVPFAGCDRSGGGKPRQTLPILALGDSYTIGEGVAENERWPVQLTAQLRAKGVAAGAPLIIAQTGWTTLELQAALDRAAPRGPFALVTLLIGVNDQFRGGKAAANREPFRKVLNRAIALAGNEPARVIVLSIPDWGVTPFAAQADAGAIAVAIDEFNRVQREETKAAGARYCDITKISRDAKTEAKLLAVDQLHPSGAMHARWVEVVLPTASEILAN